MIFEQDRLSGVLPLAERKHTNRFGNLLTLGYPLDNWGTRYGPVGPNQKRTLATGIAWLAEQAAFADVLELEWVSDSQQDAVEQAFAGARLAARVTRATSVSEINLTDGWDSYWLSRDSKHRNNIRRA